MPAKSNFPTGPLRMGPVDLARDIANFWRILESRNIILLPKFNLAVGYEVVMTGEGMQLDVKDFKGLTNHHPRPAKLAPLGMRVPGVYADCVGVVTIGKLQSPAATDDQKLIQWFFKNLNYGRFRISTFVDEYQANLVIRAPRTLPKSLNMSHKNGATWVDFDSLILEGTFEVGFECMSN